jgi:hypothetical protein
MKGPEKWWLLIATILSVMLAWGKNFMPFTNLFIDYFPGYNKFRAVTMTLVIAQFCMPLLGFMALRDYYNGSLEKKKMLNGIKIALAITGGLLLIILILPGIAGSFLNPYESEYPAWLTSALVTDRKDLLRTDTLRSLILILLGAGALLGFISGKLKKEYSILIVGSLILIDLWGAGKRYLNADRFERSSAVQKTFTPTKADAMILEDTSYYRVLNLSVSTFNDNSPTAWFHKSIGGYHGAKLKRYQELIDSAISHELALFGAAAETATSVEDLLSVFENTPVLNMLNTRYVIYNPDAPPLANVHSLGNAWFVEKAVMVENANMELSAVNHINPAKEASIDKEFKDIVKESDYQVADNDNIDLVYYQPNILEYNYTAAGERLTVFSDIYYPAGWECYIDGEESNHFRTNYVLRGMVLPAGNHRVRFEFRPSSYYTGNKISLASSILLILITAGYFIAVYLKKSKPE